MNFISVAIIVLITEALTIASVVIIIKIAIKEKKQK